jgi:hypothetical protein
MKVIDDFDLLSMSDCVFVKWRGIPLIYIIECFYFNEVRLNNFFPMHDDYIITIDEL